VPAVAARRDELDEQIADATDAGALAHERELLPELAPNFDANLSQVNFKARAGEGAARPRGFATRELRR
jgi:hypothetical protein